jgi:hypothetical protein
MHDSIDLLGKRVCQPPSQLAAIVASRLIDLVWHGGQGLVVVRLETAASETRLGLVSRLTLTSTAPPTPPKQYIMDLNVKAATDILSDPPEEMRNPFSAPSNGLRRVASNAKTSLMNGSNGTSSSTRLQVINESKEFT